MYGSIRDAFIDVALKYSLQHRENDLMQACRDGDTTKVTALLNAGTPMSREGKTLKFFFQKMSETNGDTQQ